MGKRGVYIMNKIIALFAFALLLAGCFTPSRMEPSVMTKSFSAFGGLVSKKLGSTLYVPAPKPYAFTFDGEWAIGTEYFSLEKNLAAFDCRQDDIRIELRAMNKIDLYRDTTFNIGKDAVGEQFISFYLQWDQDYWTKRNEVIKQGSVTGPLYNSERQYGTIKTVNGGYQRCVFAALVDDALYMMTGVSASSEKDLCELEIGIWESREEF